MRWIALLAVIVPAILAGCGSGSSEGTTAVDTRSAGAPSSRAGFVEVGDTICGNHQSRREDLESQAAALGALTSPAKAHQVADLLRVEARNLRSEIRELEARRPSAADIALSSFLSVVRARAKAIDGWARAYDDLDELRIRKLQFRIGVIAATAELRARKYGFSVCGQ